MGHVSDVLARKGSTVHTVEWDATVLEAIRKMVDHNLGSLIVTATGAVRGIFTERDYLRRVVLEGRRSADTKVQEVMTRHLVCIDPSALVEDCLTIMTQKRIRHLPVMDGGRLAGIVSIGDLVKFQSREREVEIRYLNDYISGNYPR